jgi:Zn-dependent metalloprotease
LFPNHHRLKWINNGGSQSLSWRKRPFFHPKPKFSTFKTKNDKQFAAAALKSEVETMRFGTRFVLGQLNLAESELNLTSFYTDTANVTHMYFKHLINGIEVSNHHAAVHVKMNHVLAFSTSFNSDDSRLKKRHRNLKSSKISEKTAISIAVNEFHVGLQPNKPIELKYIELPNGVISHVYVVPLKNSKNWLRVFVDTNHGILLGFANKRSSCSCCRLYFFSRVSCRTFEFGQSSQ